MADKPRTIKARVTLSIEIDLDEYRAAYGESESVAEIREWIADAIAAAAATPGVVAVDGVIRDVFRARAR